MVLSQADATARAEAEVRAYCGWHVAPARTDTLTLDGPGSLALLLPSLHVTAVTSVTEDGTLVAATDYQWSESGVVRRTAHATSWSPWGAPRWTDALRGLVITFTHGYTTWPLDVLSVVERLAARAVEASSGSMLLTQVGGVSYATDDDGLPVTAALTRVDRAVLDRHKLPPRP